MLICRISTQVRLHLRSPSPGARSPLPIAAKASPMPAHQRGAPKGSDQRKLIRSDSIFPLGLVGLQVAIDRNSVTA